LAYYPDQKRAENVPLSKFSSRPFFKFLGIGQTAEELQKFFDISMPDAHPEDGAYLLLLTPKWQRIKDRLAMVRFWVDEKTCLPSKLEYVETDGDSTTLTFSHFQVNPDIAEARFSVEHGHELYLQKRVLPVVGAINCASCPMPDPREEIIAHKSKVLCRQCHVINDAEHPYPKDAKLRKIAPLAPSANPKRLTDFDHVEAFLKPNCEMVFGRVCTTKEKGDVLSWIISVE